MGFPREDTCKLQETDLTTFTPTCIGANSYKFERWLGCVEALKTRSGTNDLGEMCIWLGTNFRHKTLETIGRILLEELGRCLDERLTLPDKELQAEAYGSDKGTEEHDLEKLGKDYGRKSALFNLHDTNMVVMFDVIKIIDKTENRFC